MVVSLSLIAVLIFVHISESGYDSNAKISSNRETHLSSSLPEGSHPCPLDEIIFTCQVRGSASPLILNWNSTAYIGRKRLLTFLSYDLVGANRTTPHNPNTIAFLISNSAKKVDAEHILVSKLYIYINRDSRIQTVGCSSNLEATTEEISFQVLHIPHAPHMDSQLIMDTAGRCTIHVALTPPNNIAIEDVDHFAITINKHKNINITNTNNSSLLLINQPVCNCNHHNINISAVNRCGEDGSSTSNVLQPITLPDLPCYEDNTTTDHEQTTTTEANTCISSNTTIAAISGSLAPVAFLLLITCVVFLIIIIILCKKLRKLKYSPS